MTEISPTISATTIPSDLAAAPARGARLAFARHAELLKDSVPAGPRDTLSVTEVLALLPTLPGWPSSSERRQVEFRRAHTAGAGTILRWLATHPGDGWQDRWVLSGADTDLAWIDVLAMGSGARKPSTERNELVAGLMSLLLCRIFRPSYLFLSSYRAGKLYSLVQQGFRPDLFLQLQRQGEVTAKGARTRDALVVISKLVLHTGRNVDALTAEDFFTYRAWCLSRVGKIHMAGLSLAWSLLHSVTKHSEHFTLRDAVRHGQRPTAELVDNYRLQSTDVRDVLIRYLDERRPALDYSSFRGLVGILAGSFWSDIERHHPTMTTLHLPEDVAQAWKQRMRTIRDADGTTRPRTTHLAILTRVRSFYLDIQEWALEDPSWARWSVPSPVRRGESEGQRKVRKKGMAKVHQRVRERLPHLPALVDAAERHKNEQAELLLAAATATPADAAFEHGGRHYRRRMPTSYTQPHFDGSALPVHVEDLATGITHNLSRDEDEAFWAWAIIETLRHTGVRIEELSELTHLALVSYQLPAGGEVVPMLHIVPSKSNEERLLLISPELASVLATIITRLRRDNGGTVPLTSRYDSYECVVGPPLPHLFQRRRAWKWDVPSLLNIQRLLNKTLARTGIRTVDGQPLRFTPHDFRRMFATEAVTGGLPVHIIARLLGHANINTTQAYMAVFDEDLVRAYRRFLDNRRATRPEVEQRMPTEQEWREFQQHFQTRKLELGECGRPYGTPCKHEHACIRCPSLRLDPSARPRLLAIIANLRDRVQEARLNGWLGEVDGLQTSLQAATAKLVTLDRMRERPPAGTVNLGMPIITTD